MEVRELDGIGKSLYIYLAVSQKTGMLAPVAGHLAKRKPITLLCSWRKRSRHHQALHHGVWSPGLDQPPCHL